MQSRKRFYAAILLVSGLAISPALAQDEDDRLTPEPSVDTPAAPVSSPDDILFSGPDAGNVTRPTRSPRSTDRVQTDRVQTDRVQTNTDDRIQTNTDDRIQTNTGDMPDPFSTNGGTIGDQGYQQDQTRPGPKPVTPKPVKRKVEPDPTVLDPDRQQTDRIQTDRIQVDTTVTKPSGKGDDLGWEDMNQVAPVRNKGKGADTDQSGPAPLLRHGPPGRGPKGDFKWETVDGSNQTGSKEAREALAKEIYGTGVGFSGQDLGYATRAELVDILMWLDDAEKREKGFKDNLDRSAQKLDRQKKNLGEMSLGDLYKVRVGGWFDHQKDEDDMRVAMDFKRFLQDRANRSDGDSHSIYAGILQDIDHLIMVAAPAYSVNISRTEIRSVRTVEDKFRDGDHKGAFQFAATYVMGLMLDRGNLKQAISAKGYTQGQPRNPFGKNGSTPDIYNQPPPVMDPWGKGGNRKADVDPNGNYGKGPRSPDSGQGGIDPQTRATMRQMATAGTQILGANDNYNRQMKAINDDYNAQQAAMNGQNPAAPGSANDQGLARAITDSDQMLDQVREQQRKTLDLITQWRQTQDPNQQRQIEAQIRAQVYGQNPQQPAPSSILGMLGSQQLKAALSYANQAGQSQNPAFQSAAGRIFGAGGKLDRVQRTQHEVIAQYLKDRDQDAQRQKDTALTGPNRFNPNDPNNPNNFGPNGEPPLNPNWQQATQNPQVGPNGQPLGPNGQPLGPNGQPLAPTTNGPQSPTTPNPPTQTPQTIATDPTTRLAQINQALQDPNLTPAERNNLLGEQTRIQNLLAQQKAAAATAAAQAATPVAGPAAPTSAVSAAGAADRAKAKMPNTPNSYGVAPAILSDAELQNAANGAIAAHVAAMNKELSGKGITVNDYLQYSGKGVTSTGKPSGDKYAMWIGKFPDVKDAMMKAAADAYAKKLAELTAQEAATPAPAPVATPAPVPVATPTPLPSQIGSGAVGAIVEPR